MKRETKNLEYKQVVTRSFLKTAAAFANSEGGSIVFGVTDSQEVIGIDHPIEQALSIENSVNDNISPIPSYEIDIDEKTGVITLKISPGDDTPYLYDNKAWIRRDSSTIKADRQALLGLVLQGKNMKWEELPNDNQDLTFSILEQELKSHVGIEKLGSDVLKSFSLLTKNGLNKAAGLLADQNDFPGIELVRFGETINTIRDRETIEGVSIVEQLTKAMQFFNREYQYETIGSERRKSVWRIPEAAFREAVANGLIHRNWSIPANLQVHMFDDHISIISPGPLVNGVSEESYLNESLSIPGNPILATIFLRLNIIERLGTGVLRIRESYNGTDRSPSFLFSPSSLTVRLPVIDEIPPLSPEQEDVYRVLEKNVLLSRKVLESKTGLSKTKIVEILNQLLEMQLIQRTGAGRGVKYSKL